MSEGSSSTKHPQCLGYTVHYNVMIDPIFATHEHIVLPERSVSAARKHYQVVGRLSEKRDQGLLNSIESFSSLGNGDIYQARPQRMNGSYSDEADASSERSRDSFCITPFID